MARPKLGLVLPTFGNAMTAASVRWDTIRDLSASAESMGFDTLWVIDELIIKDPAVPAPFGMWECVAVAGAVAASTSSVTVGTWVMSALHRNPALTAKVAETLDEISDGRFLFGLGSGHTGAQSEAFGYPPDYVVSRYADALEIIMPLLREGHADHQGEYHSAVDLPQDPLGPRPGKIPIMLAGHGPRTMGLAAKYADIWSGYATTGSDPDQFVSRLAQLDAACRAAGRDPLTLGRSIGVWIEPGGEGIVEQIGMGAPLAGSPAQVADAIVRFGDLGVSQVEINLFPCTPETLHGFAAVLGDL